MCIDDSEIVYIPESEHQKNIITKLNYGDVILSKTAYPAASLVTLNECNTSQDTVAIKLKPHSEIKSYFLVTYLNTKYGLSQMGRWFTGNIQMHLNLEDCKRIKIPVLSKDLQYYIQLIFEKSLTFKVYSNDTFLSTERLLLQELGLANYQPSTENVKVKSFKNSFLDSGRLDAEYYQPKFDEIDQAITQKEYHDRLGNLLSLCKRGKQPKYTEIGFKVVNSKHVREGEVKLGEDNRTAKAERNSLIIKKGDVLINGTGVGTIGRSAPYLYEEQALPDNHVTILRTRKLDPVYLSIFLNSIAGQLQVDKYFKGSSGQIELYPQDISEFLIWVAPKEIQERIRENVESAHISRENSKHLLVIAKRGVELAIEQNEEHAIAWMEAEVNKLGIEL